MAEVAFHYFPGTSFLHRADARHKLVSLIVLCASVLASSWAGLTLCTAAIAATVAAGRVPVAFLLRELRAVAVLVAIVLGAAALRSVGTDLHIASAMIGAVRYSWQLVDVVAAAAVFTAVTPVRDLRRAIERLLRFAPPRTAGTAAAMIAFTIGFIPLITDQAHALRGAQASRGLNARRNPLRALRYLGLPLIVRTLRRVDSVSRAADARCFDLRPPPPPKRTRGSDWILLATTVFLSAAAVVVGRV